MAAKSTAIGLVAVPAIGCVALLIRSRRSSDAVRLASLGLGAFVSYRVLNPGAFGGLGLWPSAAFRADLERARALGESSAPPSFQWVGRVPIVQPLVWLTTFSLGPGVILAASAGVAVITLRYRGAALVGWLEARRRPWARAAGRPLGRSTELMTDVGGWTVLVLLGGVVLPFMYVALTALPTARYFYPALPALFALAGLGVAAGLRAAGHRRGARRRAALVVPVLALATAALWGIGFVTGVYGPAHTRIQASRWIEANVPPGSQLSSEAWDDGLPLSLPGIDRAEFGYRELNLVGPDDEAKVAILAEQLAELDYVVESSPRIWGSVVRMPARFPSTIKFFEGLDSGAFGFERVATFTGGIRIGRWHLLETNAEEAFSVYDHPEVRIWQRVRNVDRATIIRNLAPDAAATAVPVLPSNGAANGLSLFDREIAAKRRRTDLRRGVRHPRGRSVSCDRLVRRPRSARSRRLPDVPPAVPEVARRRARARQGVGPDRARVGGVRRRQLVPPDPRSGAGGVADPRPARRRRPAGVAVARPAPIDLGRSASRPDHRRDHRRSMLLAVRRATCPQSRSLAPVARRREAVRAGVVDGSAADADVAGLRPVVRRRGVELLLRRLVPAVGASSSATDVADARDEPGAGGVLDVFGGFRILHRRGTVGRSPDPVAAAFTQSADRDARRDARRRPRAVPGERHGARLDLAARHRLGPERPGRLVGDEPGDPRLGRGHRVPGMVAAVR